MRRFGTSILYAALALLALAMVYDDMHINLLGFYVNYDLDYTQYYMNTSGRNLDFEEESSEELSEETSKESSKKSSEVSVEESANGKKKEVCFVNSSFGKSKDELDKSLDVTSMHDEKVGFFFFTNVKDLKTPGWEKIVLELPYKRFITQSRWAKFMAWKDPTIAKSCKAVFYFDVSDSPKLTTEQYISAAKKCRSSEFGLTQAKHMAGSITQEFKNILNAHKDIQKNVDASMKWFKKQPDYKDEVKSFRNDQILYDPENVHFQKAAEFFWERYSLELDSWRDQPLWWYTLHHFNIIPQNLERLGFNYDFKRMGHGGHKYGEDNANDALVAKVI
mmetsp:Transcript_15801/g.23196  ORF Transcript_15801/g.23196 Transcript_15801/m.23196 type:complete len:334 (-) Transcript_15801:290-1291(-)